MLGAGATAAPAAVEAATPDEGTYCQIKFAQQIFFSVYRDMALLLFKQHKIIIFAFALLCVSELCY